MCLRERSAVPKQRFERREPTHDWQQLRPLFKDQTQLTYEIIRPVVLGWDTPKERSAETGMPQLTIYFKANLFDQAGMASLLPPDPQPVVPKLHKRSLPPPMRQAIVDLKAKYPVFTLKNSPTMQFFVNSGEMDMENACVFGYLLREMESQKDCEGERTNE